MQPELSELQITEQSSANKAWIEFNLSAETNASPNYLVVFGCRHTAENVSRTFITIRFNLSVANVRQSIVSLLANYFD